MASFCPISLMRESPEVVARFVDFYREAGAGEIRVYCDGPVPDIGPTAPGVNLIACDDAFWAGLGGRPEGLEERQAIVYVHGMAACATDWALIVDADEFVFGDRSIGSFLDRIPAGVDAVSVPTAEAVWGPGDDLSLPFGSTHFRLAWGNDTLWSLFRRPFYGAVSGSMQRGLAGHRSGKEFLRTGRPYSSIRNHTAQRDGKTITRVAGSIDPSLARMWVGHFDAIGLARWAEKWRLRIERDTITANMTKPRERQMDMVATALETGNGASLFRRVYGLSRVQYAMLAAIGYAFRRPIFSGGA